MDAKVYCAALEGSWEDVSNFQDWYDQSTYRGDTILHVHLGTPRHPTRAPWYRRLMFWKTVWKADMEFIKHVLHDAQGGTQSFLWRNNADREIPLHIAAKFGHVQAVEEFLRQARLVSPEEVRKMVSKVNKWRDTALHLATRAGYDQIVKLLVDADSRCPQEPNDDNETPLYLAAESECEPSVAAILDICDSPALDYAHRGPCGLTALHLLVQWDTKGILIKKILDKDEYLLRLQDETGSTPLHWAAASGKAKQLSVLLSYDKNTHESAAYIQDNDGQTPLHTAAFNYNLDCMKELVSRRPDSMDVVDSKGQNVLHYAANWACIKKLEYFLKEFDHHRRLRKLLNSRDLSGETPLHLVAANIPRMNCGCKWRVRNFMKGQQQYLKSFNKDNLTVQEIVDSHIYPWEGTLGIVRNYYGSPIRVEPLGHKCKRMKKNENSENASRKAYEEGLEKYLADLKKGAETELIVAALVATVSFTAGFTLPGGLNQQGPDIGMAVLANNPNFKDFMMSNTSALSLSSTAVVFYLFSTASLARTVIRVCLLVIAKFLTWFSTIKMIDAFVEGIRTVLPNSLASTSPLLFSPLLYFSMIGSGLYLITHPNSGWPHPKVKK